MTNKQKLAQYIKGKGDVKLTEAERKLLNTEDVFEHVHTIYAYRKGVYVTDGGDDFDGDHWSDEIWGEVFDSIVSRL